MKTMGAETINKRINWRVELKDGGELQFKDLKSLCDELEINRTSVYKIQTGRSRPLRQKEIINIEKIYIKENEL